MKTDTDKTILEELQQVLSLEDSILGSLSPEITAETTEFVDNAEKTEKKPNLNKIARNNNILLGIITDQVRVKRVWRFITVCLVIFAITVSFICFSFYKSRENLAEKLGEITILEKKLAEAKAETASIRANIMASNTELKDTQSELNNSKAEIKTLQDQLAAVTQRLETLQNRNAEAVKLLSGRLQRLSNPSANKAAPDSQTAPDPKVSGK